MENTLSKNNETFSARMQKAGYIVVSGWTVEFKLSSKINAPIDFNIHYESAWRLDSPTLKDEYFATENDARLYAIDVLKRKRFELATIIAQIDNKLDF